MLRFTLCFALLACGGSGADPDASVDGPLPDTPGFDTGGLDTGADATTPPPGRPVFTIDRIASGSDQAALITLTQPGETVDLLAFTPLELWHMEIGSGSAEAVLTLTESLGFFDPPPSAMRASDGSLHVVWETSSSVRYATNSSGTWVESEVASNGRTVSLALDASDVPHVAYIRVADEVNVARLEGDTWTPEVVGSAPGGRGLPWTAIARQEDRLVLAGSTGVGTFWLRDHEGAGWSDEQPFDVGDAIFMERSGEESFAAGNAGTLLSFQSNNRYAAFQRTGASVQVATLGATFELALDEPIATAVGNDTAFVAAQDFGQRLVVVAPGDSFWPLVAAVPWDDCGDNVALSMDADDNPIMATWCSGEVTLFRADGNYPPEFDARCEEAVTALCDQACACGGPDGDACGYFVEGSTNSGNLSGCRLSARETLCSDSTEPFETLTSCLAALVPGTCDVNGYSVPEVCWPLSRL